MKHSSPSLNRHFVIYGLGALIAKVILFVLEPIYALTMGAAEYGMVAVLAAFHRFLVQSLDLGQAASLTRLYYEYQEPEQQKRVVSSIVLAWTGIAVLATLALLAVLARAGAAIFDGIPFQPHLGVTTIAAVALVGGRYLRTVWRVQERAGLTVLLDVFERALLLISVLALIAGLEMGIHGWLIAISIWGGVMLLISYVQLSRMLTWKIDWALVRESYRIGLPLGLHAVAGWVLTLSDRLIINQYLDFAQVGYYSLAYALAQGLGMITYAINEAYLPRLMRLYRDGGAYAILLRQVTLIMMGFVALGSILLILLGPFLLGWFGGEPFLVAVPLLSLLGFSFVIETIYKISIARIFLVKRMHYIPMLTIVAATLNIIMNVILIPHFGIWGASLATLCSMGVLVATSMAAARWALPVALPWSTLSLLMGGVVLVEILRMYSPTWIYVPVSILIMVATAGATYWKGIRPLRN